MAASTSLPDGIPEEYNIPVNVALWNRDIINVRRMFVDNNVDSQPRMFEPREQWDVAIVDAQKNKYGFWVPVYDADLLIKAAMDHVGEDEFDWLKDQYRRDRQSGKTEFKTFREYFKAEQLAEGESWVVNQMIPSVQDFHDLQEDAYEKKGHLGAKLFNHPVIRGRFSAGEDDSDLEDGADDQKQVEGSCFIEVQPNKKRGKEEKDEGNNKKPETEEEQEIRRKEWIRQFEQAARYIEEQAKKK